MDRFRILNRYVLGRSITKSAVISNVFRSQAIAFVQGIQKTALAGSWEIGDVAVGEQ